MHQVLLKQHRIYPLLLRIARLNSVIAFVNIKTIPYRGALLGSLQLMWLRRMVEARHGCVYSILVGNLHAREECGPTVPTLNEHQYWQPRPS